MAVKKLVFDINSTRENIQKCLKENKSANELVLENCKEFTADDFADLIKQDLSSIKVHGSCLIDDSTLEQLSEKCLQLKSFSLCGSLKGITSKGIEAIFKNCHQLKSFSVSFCELDDVIDGNKQETNVGLTGDDLLLTLCGLECTVVSLEHFGFCGFDDVTFHGLKNFLELIKNTLISVDLSELSCIDDFALTVIGEICPNLTTIIFNNCTFTDAAFGGLCLNCERLQSIDVCGCEKLTDQALIAIARNCKSLKRINLARCLNITETVLEELARNCLELEFVDVSQCAIKHIPIQLTKLLSLKELRADGCSCLKCPPLTIVKNGLEATQKFLLECHVESRCRVAFLGNRGSGKSSLVLSLPTLALAVSDSGTDGVHSELWQPFHDLTEDSQLCELVKDTDEKVKDLSVELWDCGGRKCFHNIHPLFLKEETLYVILFDINKVEDLNNVPYWIQMIQTKSPGAPFILVGSHADSDADYSDEIEHVLNSVRTAKQKYYHVIEQELTALKDIAHDRCVHTRIEKLTYILNRQYNKPRKVFLVSTIKGKGVAEIQKEIVRLLVDKNTFPHLHQDVSTNIRYLNAEIVSLRQELNMIVSWDEYLGLTSAVGIVDADEVEQATKFLERKGSIIVFNLAEVSGNKPISRIVCTNPAGLLKHIACIHTDLDPKEYVPRFVKSGYIDKYWPAKTKPNEWTLRSAIDDIVAKGLIRESVIPLCFQASHLKEEEVMKLLELLLKLGVLVEGAPKGSYEVELVLVYYKNLSVFKRYYLPFLDKLPETCQNLAKVWPASVSENSVQVAWQYRFPDLVSANCSTCVIGACRNYKRSCNIIYYWRQGIILGVGNVLVRISLEGNNLDVIGRSEITRGSKQALNMTWYVLAQFLYVIESHLSNYSGICPEVSVPVEGCDSPRRKPLCELIQDYNLQASHFANYRWFLPPAGLDPEDHEKIPGDICSWLSLIACKSLVYISYDIEHQNEVKLLCNYFDNAGFDCAGELFLTEHDQDLTENRKQILLRSSLLVVFVTSKLYNSMHWLP